jgi:hypothetical protein
MFTSVLQKKRVGEFTFSLNEERTLQTHWFPLLDEDQIQEVVA